MNFTADRALFEGLHNCAGVVGPRLDFSTNVGPGQQRPQAVDENGVLLWVVEALRLVEKFGRARMKVYTVQVPAPQQPVLAPGPVRFKDLRVTVSTRLQRQGTGRDARIVGVTENVYWDASGVEQVRAASESKGVA
ncbi:MAG: hypothetical protein IPM00_08145 [Tetrasphaera sp.]|nr:hypothetical protein [Tetrasphaera sp.]